MTKQAGASDGSVQATGTRVFSYLMNSNVKMTDSDIFEDVSSNIYKALKKTHQINSSEVNISKAAFEIALNQLI